MFADEANGIDGKVVASQRQRVFDRWIDREAMLLRQRTAYVVFRNLIRVQRDDFSARLDGDAIGRIAVEQTSHDDSGVGLETIVVAVERDDGGDFLLSRGLSLSQTGRRARGHEPTPAHRELFSIHVLSVVSTSWSFDRSTLSRPSSGGRYMSTNLASHRTSSAL